jgi:hypothetical protein
MENFDSEWVEAHVNKTAQIWQNCSAGRHPLASRYDTAEQEQREHAYDEALAAAEAVAGTTNARERLVPVFGQFAARALGLDGDAIHLLTDDFLPIGTELGWWARRFDPSLSVGEVIQAARNAWTACGLQPLLGEPVALTPAIFGYSLIYPYSDNYLDDNGVDAQTKCRFSRRFRDRLSGKRVRAANHRERALWRLVGIIEAQYPRSEFPGVFECLLAIHQAQEQSLQQVGGAADVLRLSCAKGGTSVLADACLIRGWLTEAESSFAFEWGVLLQLGDDLQDLREDMRRGSETLFALAAASGKPLDDAAIQLLRFSEHVGRRMNELPSGSLALKELLKMSWRSLITRAIADSHEFFSPGFVREAERCSPFRFDFLRRRSARLASRHGLYEAIINDAGSVTPAGLVVGA